MNENVFSFPIANGSASKAQEWIVRIDAGPLTSQERSDLQAWLSEDPHHVELLDTLALIWSEAARAEFPAQSFLSSTALNPQKKFIFGRTFELADISLSWKLWVGVSAFFAMCFFFLLSNQTSTLSEHVRPVHSEIMTSVATEIGQNLELPLTDGSRVRLNTASTIRVEFTKKNRRILLERGEGFFDVAKDVHRPFEVIAGQTTVRAVGTKFSVVHFPDGRTDVTVFEGIVEVLTSQSHVTSQPLRLGVGQTLTVQSEQIALQQLSMATLGNKLAWTDDRIIFDNTSLLEAVTQVNRYSSVPFRITDQTLLNLHISGAFSTPDIQVFIRSLEQGFGLHVEKTADAYLIQKENLK